MLCQTWMPIEQKRNQNLHLKEKQIKIVLLTESCGCEEEMVREKQRQSEVKETGRRGELKHRLRCGVLTEDDGL